MASNNTSGTGGGGWGGDDWLQLALTLGLGAAGAVGAKKQAKESNKPQEAWTTQTKVPYMAGMLNPQLQMIAALAAQNFEQHMKKINPNFAFPSTTTLPWGASISDPYNDPLQLAGMGAMLPKAMRG